MTCGVFTAYVKCILACSKSILPFSVAQLNARPTGDQEIAGSTPAGSATFFREIDHEIFSTVIPFR